MGGIGNQMFIISSVIGLAHKNKVGYKIPASLVPGSTRVAHFSHFPVPSSSDIVGPIYKEPSFCYSSIPYYPGVCLFGYFQSEKYFSFCREEILSAFGIPYSMKKGWVSIHVRRGDYVPISNIHPPVSIAYIHNAISYFFKLGYYKFIVFSDDIPWCRTNINIGFFPFCEFDYSIGNTELEDLCGMSSCEHNIIANSSFSWWGAWLNQYPSKIVVAPSVWFGPEKPLDTRDLLPSDWIVLPC